MRNEENLFYGAKEDCENPHDKLRKRENGATMEPTIAEITLFQGYLNLRQRNRKRVKVTLTKTTIPCVKYKLKIGNKVVTFSAEDLHFFEKDEIELRTGPAFLSCLSARIPYSKHKQCQSVTLLIKTDELVDRINLCGPTQRHLRERSIGTLWNALHNEFGVIRSWFVNIPEISQSENSRLRFVLTRENFCVLDSSYNIYHDYKFRMVKCDVSFDIETDMVELKVYTDDGVYHTNFVYESTIHLRACSSFADDLRALIVRRSLKGSPVADMPDFPPGPPSPSIASSSHESPPPPCPPPSPHRPAVRLPSPLLQRPPKLCRKTYLIRSESIACMALCDDNSKRSHYYVFYENIFHCDDRLYINERFPNPFRIKMEHKIDRWNRLSDELEQVDEETASKHWLYFDNQFQHRSWDHSYRKICNAVPMYDNPRPTGSDCEVHEAQEYWESDLSLSIQRVMEGRVPKMWDILNITHNQYLELSMKLDLRNNGPRARDWTEFAEWTGIKKTLDIEIIQHFCYTRKMVIMDVVFCHWYFQYQRRRSVPACNHDMLKIILLNMERHDLIRVIQNNYNIPVDDSDIESDDDNTQF